MLHCMSIIQVFLRGKQFQVENEYSQNIRKKRIQKKMVKLSRTYWTKHNISHVSIMKSSFFVCDRLMQ